MIDFSDQAEVIEAAPLDFSSHSDKAVEDFSEQGFDAPKGFYDNLSPRIQEAVENPSSALFHFGKQTKSGGLAHLVKRIANTAPPSDLETYKNEMKRDQGDIANIMDKMEAEGLQHTPEYQALAMDFEQTTIEAESDKEPDSPGFQESMKGIYSAFKKDPGALAAEFVNVLTEDPELLVIPLGAEKAAAVAASRGAGMAGRLAAAGGGAAVTGAVTEVPLSISRQLKERDEVSLERIGRDASVAAAFSVPLGTVAGLRPRVNSLSRVSGESVQEIERLAMEQVTKGKTLDEALNNLEEVVSNQPITKPIKAESSFKLDPSVKLKSVAKEVDDNANLLSKYKQSKQAGFAKPALLAGLGLGGAGALIGYGEQGVPGAIAGAAAGIMAPYTLRLVGRTGKSAVNVAKRVFKEDKRMRIDKLADVAEGQIKVGSRATWQFRESIKEAIPDPIGREKITRYLEGEDIKLDPSELKTANSIKKFFDDFGELGKKEEVLSGLLENYVPHFWHQKGLSKSEFVEKLSGGSSMGGGRSPRTPHAKERTIPTYKEGIEMGFIPRTMDIAELVKMYGDSVNRAIANKRLIQSLKGEIAPNGNPLIMSTKDAPSSYVSINHRQLSGVRIHPEIEPSMRFLFDPSDPNVWTRGLLAVNFASKRLLVSMSFFHANALLESMMYAGIIPRVGHITGKQSTLQALRHGNAGDAVDVALRNGLEIGVIEDVGTDIFYAALNDLASFADNIKVGGVVRGFERINRKVDEVMWDRIATGGKLTVFMKEYEKELIKSAQRHKKNPQKFPLESPDEIAKDVAEYVNDAFGGLNWRRIAEGVQNQLGRDLALAANAPSGRRAMQLAMFAPDWTIANLRILGKAIPGISKNKRIARLHQKYAVRGALFYGLMGDALNLYFSGHHFWENEDPTMIDLGDNRKMVFSKQFVEPFHWAADPFATGMNKMGILPKYIMEQGMGKKYISAKGAPPMYKKDATSLEQIIARAKHTGSKFTPIFMQQVYDQGPSGMAGFFGHPIYGTKK